MEPTNRIGKPLLAHQSREQLYSLASRPEGITASEAGRALRSTRLAARYHLRVLADHGALSVQIVGNRALYFRNGAPSTQEERLAFALLSGRVPRTIVRVLSSRPKISLRDLAREVGTSSSNAFWTTRRLARAGLLRIRKGSGGSSYELDPALVSAVLRRADETAPKPALQTAASPHDGELAATPS